MSDPATRIRPLTVVLAVVAALVVAVAGPVLAHLAGSSAMGGYLPMLPALLALLAAPLLRPRECVLLLVMTLGAAGVGSYGLAGPWSEMLFARPLLAQSAGSAPVAEEVHAHLSVGDPKADPATQALFDGMQRGGQPLYDEQGALAIPLAPLVQPLLWTGGIVLLAIILVVALGAATARQWNQHERLQHPLGQVHGALIGGPLWRDRGFLAALAVMGVWWLYNLTANYHVGNPLPPVQTVFTMPELHRLLGMDAPTSWTRQALESYWGGIRIYPVVIGLAFLLTLDVGFSAWAGFWIGMAVFGWLYAAGIPVNFDQHGRLVGAGATLALAVAIAWVGRHHYLALLRAAFGAGSSDDRLGVWGVRCLLASAVGLVVLLALSGAGVGGALCGVLLVLAYLVVIARVVAESGLVTFQAASELSLAAYALGLPLLLPIQAMLALLWLGQTFLLDTREQAAGYLAQGQGLATQHALPAGRTTILLGGTLVVCAFAALFTTLALRWTADQTGGMSVGEMRAEQLLQARAPAVEAHDAAWSLFGSQLFGGPMLAGVLLVVALVAARRFWTGFPFHPIGVVVAFSWPLWNVWGSLMLGWLAKVLVLRYGGVALYQRLKAVALGLIVGDLLGLCVQYAVVVGAKLAGSPVKPWIAFPP